MNRIAKTAGCSIYCGDQLTLAAERSYISDDMNMVLQPSRFAGISRVLTDFRNARYREAIPRSCVVTGTERDSGYPVTIQVAGTLRVTDFCANAIFGNRDYQCAPSSLARIHGVDIVVSDHPLANPWLRNQRSMRVPTWVRQQLPIAANWAATLANLPSSLRKEIGRILRRHQYLVKISSGRSAIHDYYRELHEPYLTKRFGRNTILSSEEAFVGQCQHMVRLDLIHRNSVVAASLLELQESKLAIRNSSMHPGAKESQGCSDALDYFALLIGQLLDLKTLDFGLSRPHLEDGPFRYKAKWGTILSPAGGLKSDIRIMPLKRTEATLAFLRRNYFLQNAGDGFFVRVLYDERAALDGPEQVAALRRAAGLTNIELAYSAGQAQPQVPPDSGLSLHPISDPKEPLGAIMAGR